MKINKRIALVLGLSALLLLAGCAGKQAFRKGQELALKGDYDAAVSKYMEAVDHVPDKHEYRIRLDETLGKAAWAHLDKGREQLQAGNRQAAVDEYRKALEYDKGLQVAEDELKKAERLLQADKLVVQADEFLRGRRLQQARKALDEALLIEPQNAAGLALLEKVKSSRSTVVDGVELDMTSNKPITLKFRDTSIKDAFNILSKLTGVNFILDEEVKKKSFTFELVDVSFPQAIELILQMNKLGKKVVNSKTIIIYAKGKDGDKLFADQLIQTFYLSNIDAKKAVNLLRTMLQLRRVYVHEELNAIVVRDTPDVIKLCSQLLEAADRADAEVLFELDLIEVNHSDKLDFGPKLSSNSVSVGMGQVASNGTPALVSSSLESGKLLIKGSTGLDDLKVFYTLPSLTFDFLKTKSDSETLANPKIRVKNKEKSKVLVGRKQPIITVTKTSGSNDFTENVTYVDVGVKLNIEPTVQLDNSIITKIEIEVSSLGEKITGTQSTVYPITTTNANTVLTLKDGERTIIGGLINDDKSKSKLGVAFLTDLPLIGPLFSSNSNSKSKREILLSITPHIIQNVVVPEASISSIWSGNEDDLKAGQVFGAFSVGETTPEPEVATKAQKSKPVPPPAPATPSPPTVPAVVPPSTTDPVPATPVPITPAAVTPAPVEIVPPAALPAPIPELASSPADEPAAAIVPAETAPTVPVAAPVATETVPVPPATTVAPVDATAVTLAPIAAAPAVEKKIDLPAFDVPPAADGRLLISGPNTLAVGQDVILDVQLQGVASLYSAPLFVVFDQTRFELLGAEEGDLLRQNGAQTVFTSSRVAGRGELIVGYKQGVGGAGATGDGLLFRVKLRAKSAGTGEVRLDRLNLRDVKGTRLKIEGVAHKIEVR